MSFGAGFALATGNPIGAALEVFQQLIAAFGQGEVYELIRRLQKLTSQFQVMRQNGLFGSQVQLRKVQDRSIWESIGYAEPADVPHLFQRAPAGTTFTVKDKDFPENDFTSLWATRRLQDYAYELRFPEGTWWGSVWNVSPGDPPDTIPGIGREGVVRQDFDPRALALALARQPQVFLGPRALAGEDAASRRAAFRAGGGNAGALWLIALREQSRREGRRVRAFGGMGWIDIDPSTPILDERTATAFRSSDLRTFGIGSGPRDPVLGQIRDLLTETRTVYGIGPRGTPVTTRPFEAGQGSLLTRRAAEQLFSLGIRGPSDFRQLPQLLGAT